MAEAELSELEKQALDEYANTLKRYIDPKISPYYPIGWRHRPKTKRLVAEEVYATRERLQEQLKLGGRWGCGEYKLDIRGVPDNPRPGSWYSDEGYWWILPVRSYNKEHLDYLAVKMHEMFPDKEFYVKSTMIPCNGCCSWDTK